MTTRYAFFLLIRTTPAWLALPRARRRDIAAATFQAALARYPSVRARAFDAEAFTGRCTDVVLFETAEPRDYYHVIETLRDTVLWTVPYFEVVDILVTTEDGFVAYEASASAAP